MELYIVLIALGIIILCVGLYKKYKSPVDDADSEDEIEYFKTKILQSQPLIEEEDERKND